MAKFEVRVRLLDVAGHDGYAVRRLVDERLRSAGFSRWLITSVEVQQPTDVIPRPRTPAIARPAFGSAANVVLISAAVVIGLWFWFALF
jgi:hypothetical protein